MTYYVAGSPARTAFHRRARAKEILKEARHEGAVRFTWLELRAISRYGGPGVTYSEMRATAEEALRIHAGQPMEIPMLTDDQATEIVTRALKVEPDLSQTELREEVGRHGRYTDSQGIFRQLVNGVRWQLSIKVSRGRRGRKSA